MPTAALSQIPVGSAAPADTDVEAPPFVAFHTGIDQRQRADDAPTAAAGGAEAETAPVGGNGGGASAVASSLSSVRRQGSDFPLFALGFAALISLVFIVSDLLNKRTFHPVSAGVFLLSMSYCVAVLKRQWWGSNTEATPEAPSEGAGVLSKEAREALLTYFVFDGPGPAAEAEKAPAAADGEAADQPPRPQDKPGQQGKGIPPCGSDLALLDNSTRGGGGGRKLGDPVGTAVDTDSISTDTDSLPTSTPAASPGPSTPVPVEQQPRSPGSGGGRIEGGGDSVGDGTGDTASAAASATAADVSAVVARVCSKKLDNAERGVQRVEGGERGQARESESSPLDGGEPVVEAATATHAAAPAATVDTLAEGTGRTAPEVSAKTDTVVTAGEAAGEVTAGRSDAGEWSTDQSCIVCFGDYYPGDLLCRLPCRHVYHAKCIDEWLDRARFPCCPLCKTDLLLEGRPGDGDASSTAAASAASRSADAAGSGGGSGGGGGGGGGRAAAAVGVEEVDVVGENAV